MRESGRKRMELEVNTAKSEKMLNDLLGTNALQAIVPRELSLQVGPSMNTSHLQSLDMGGLPVNSEIRKRVFILREALELPPCNASADLDELLLSTMEALHKLYPGKLPSTFSFMSSEGDQKPIFQRLQQFYKSLQAMEDTWVDSFDHKAGAVEEKRANDAGLNQQEHSSVSSASTSALKRTDSKKNRRQGHKRELSEDAAEEKWANDAGVNQHEHSSVSNASTSALKRTDFKKNRSQGHKRNPFEDGSNLEQLSLKIFETLDDLSRRARNILEMKEDDECQSTVSYEMSDFSDSSRPLKSADPWSDLNLESKVYSQAPLTPTSVLRESTQTSVKPRIFVNAFAPPLLWLPRNQVTGSPHPICFKDFSVNIGTQGLDPKHSLTTTLDKMEREQPSNPEKSTQGPALKHSLTTHLENKQRDQPRNYGKRINGVNMSTWENPESKCGVQIPKHNKPVGESKQALKTITNTIQGSGNSISNTSAKLIVPPPSMVSTPPLSPPMIPAKSLPLSPPMVVATAPLLPMVSAKCLPKHSFTTNLDMMQGEKPGNPENSTQGLALEHTLTTHSEQMQREQQSNSVKKINSVNSSTCDNPGPKCGVQISKYNKPSGESNQPLNTITNTIKGSDNSSKSTSTKLIFLPPSAVSTPPLLPPMIPAKSLPPPPPMVVAKPLPPPPPPPPLNANKALCPRRSNTKLKRSSQMGNLYRVLKSKVEGAGQTGKSSQARRKLIGGNGNNGTKGMAEALAEITRRSSYFRQIEEDVQRFATQIMEMKRAIECFETRNMDELLKFHHYCELQLEDLTDETQVLARFESFPTKKLEVVRAAATLHSKLSSIDDHLNTLQVVPPLSQQLDKVTCYFDKIKTEVEALERIKDEEAKRFERHKIFFDFNVIIRIKESMVDVSSSCIALALEESKATKAAPSKGVGDMMGAHDDNRLRRCLQMLWRAFQLSFRVYNFAGGQDERAEELTCVLAREIQTYPQQYWPL